MKNKNFQNEEVSRVRNYFANERKALSLWKGMGTHVNGQKDNFKFRRALRDVTTRG